MIQKFLNWKTIFISTLVVLFVLSSLNILQTPDNILEDVLVTEEGSALVMKIQTSIPVYYVDHYPSGRSSFIQVKVRVVSLLGADKNEYMGSESILPGFIEQVPIIDVAYEGDVPGGPFISMHFKEPVNYQIKEDPELKGLFIYISKKAAI